MSKYLSSNSFSTNFFLRFLCVAFLVSIDQGTKSLAKLILNDKTKYKVFDFFYIVDAWNDGVSFGLFQDLAYSNITFTTIAVAISLILSYLVFFSKKINLLPVILVLGGALGNIIDRLRFESVFDFILIKIDYFHFPAFNIADSLVFCGIMCILFKGTKNA